MPDKKDDKILRQAKKRREKYAKKTTGVQAEKLKAGVGREDYILEPRGKGRTLTYHVGGEKTEKKKDKPDPSEPEIAHKITGEKGKAEVQKVYDGKESGYDPKKYTGRLTQSQKETQKKEGPPRMEKTATIEKGGDAVRIKEEMKYSDKDLNLKRGKGYEPQEKPSSGRVAGQEFRTSGEKSSKAKLASIAGFRDPDILTKTRTSGPGLTHYKGKPGKKMKKVETGRTREVVKTKTFTADKPTKEQVRAKEIKAKQAREAELQREARQKGRDVEIKSVGGPKKSKIKYKTADINPETGKSSRHYIETTEKFKGKGRKMKTVVKQKRKKYSKKDKY